MNRLHAITKIQRAVFDDGITDPKDVFLKLRFVIPNGGADELMPRKEIEALAEHAIAMLKNVHFPVERAHLALDILEGELRADLLDALASLDVTEPNVCREVFEMHRNLGNSTGPASLRECVDMLAEGGAAEELVADLATRLAALYPPDKED
jgi:hypothetical protein